MTARKHWVLPSALLVVGALVTSVPSSATSTRTPVDFWQVACLLDPGIAWVSDEGILHGRGRVEQLVLYALDPDAMTAEIVGSGVVVANSNIELATGDGRLFGTVSVTYLPASATGTFDGRYQGSLTGGTSISGQGVSQGSGAARGLKIRLSFGSEPLPPWLLAELPTACPPGMLVGVLHSTGFVHDRRGG